MELTLTLNGKEVTADIEPRLLLVHFIRENQLLTGTHIGCDSSNCGACSVLVDGMPVKSCTYLAMMANGKSVETVEGLKQNGQLHPLQKAFKNDHGLQCGYCTPGMMMVGKALLEKNNNPTDKEVRWEISGNLCRCTGYMNIVKAIQSAGREMAEQDATSKPAAK